MTREEAIMVLKNEQPHCGEKALFSEEKKYEAYDVAIKALEQEPVLDKIRAEIEGLTYYWCEVNPKSVIDDALQIIDKYKAESEDK